MGKILVLEDDDHFRRVLVEALADEGYDVEGCGSGDEAVEKARQEEFHLIIADVKMKGLDGLAAVSLVQSIQPEMGSLVVTGYADQLENSRAENLCMDAFLKKPFDLNHFLDKVEELLAKRTKANSLVLFEKERVEWARWVNDREATNSKLDQIADLLRISRSLSSRIGLGHFESEQMLSYLLWMSGQKGKPIPDILKRFVRTKDKSLLGDAFRALLPIFGVKQEVTAPEYLHNLIQELKDQEQSEESQGKNLLETAYLLFQRGDAAFEKVLDEFLSSHAAFGRDRIRGQFLRAEHFLRIEQADKATQTVKRTMESARQDGPLTLSEACLTGGQFFLRQGQFEDAKACFLEARSALSSLGFPDQTQACELLLELLDTKTLDNGLKSRLAELSRPGQEAVLRAFHSSLSLALERLGVKLESLLEKDKDESKKPRLELYSLGGFKVCIQGQEVPIGSWRSSKARQLFIYLALETGRLSEESLVEQFWPGDPAKGRNNLYTASSYIRNALRKAGLELDPLDRSGGVLRISADLEVWHDCEELLKTRDSAELRDWRRALNLHHGTFLPDCYLDWAEEIKRTVDESVLDFAVKLGQDALEHSRLTEAIESGRKALGISPCLDSAHILVLSALIKQNRFLEAIRHYESCKQTYQLELESSPPIDVERLYQMARLSV